MTRVIEEAGFPITQLCNLTDIAKSIGANRLVQGKAIPNPTGDPSLSTEAEFKFRKDLLGRALNALTVSIDEPTLF